MGTHYFFPLAFWQISKYQYLYCNGCIITGRRARQVEKLLKYKNRQNKEMKSCSFICLLSLLHCGFHQNQLDPHNIPLFGASLLIYLCSPSHNSACWRQTYFAALSPALSEIETIVHTSWFFTISSLSVWWPTECINWLHWIYYADYMKISICKTRTMECASCYLMLQSLIRMWMHDRLTDSFCVTNLNQSETLICSELWLS